MQEGNINDIQKEENYGTICVYVYLIFIDSIEYGSN